MDWLLDLDRTLLLKINRSWVAPWADNFFPYMTDFHKTNEFHLVVLPFVLILILWLQGKKGVLTLFSLTLTLAIDDFLGGTILKHWIERPRPEAAGVDIIARAPFGGFSFPSLHAMNISCAAMFLSLTFPKARWFFIFFALIICYSRSYVGAHYPLDWIGGALIGGTMGYLGFQLKYKFEQYRARTQIK